ncbi:uncharacterized protein LOC129773828 [Toxorhynchites rutilus septentrionalis]|uniref:uncharacterized protein LOC129773828 n=1 Tax=Toxorhynchites rutilus septentrionalis TaxID=329112 RepID=UPI00247890E5|nr:uncharacterized protein LOC129773828 [Toxorhynchites rutilus septentrionalis]
MATSFLQQQEEKSETFSNTALFQSLIGALLYIAVNTRPDIAIATFILERRVTKETLEDWTERNKVLRYLKGTMNYELHLDSGEQLKFKCFVDADGAGEATDRKSNTGFIFKLSGGHLGCSCRKQKLVALSSTEAEYVALAERLQELLWLGKLMVDLSEPLPQPIVVYEDNQSCIASHSSR